MWVSLMIQKLNKKAVYERPWIPHHLQKLCLGRLPGNWAQLFKINDVVS